ncbi:Mitotic spindle assembly checkpoint protein MAD1 [Gurleya vavrai]
MESLFQKYKEALTENENLSIELQRYKTKASLLQEELNMVSMGQGSRISEDLVNENTILTNRNKMLENRLKELEEQKNTENYESHRIRELEDVMKENEKKFREFYVKTKKYVMGLLGYDINFTENTVELLSLYAFQKENKFVFQVSEESVELLSNEFVEGYKEEIDVYLNKGKSIPAFLAEVTLDLMNKKTFN